jgi:hypothetical protein
MTTNISPMMKADDGNVVRLWWDQARNNTASTDQGRPIYDKVLKIEIRSPGAKNQIVTPEVERVFWCEEGGEDRPPRVNQVIYQKYAPQIEAYKKGAAEEMAGTPLHEIREFDVSMIASLKELGFYTVEALANAPDNNVQFMGGQKWRTLARNYLESAKEQQPLSQLSGENEALRNQVAEMEAKIAELEALIDEQTAPTPEKPGSRKSNTKKAA